MRPLESAPATVLPSTNLAEVGFMLSERRRQKQEQEAMQRQKEAVQAMEVGEFWGRDAGVREKATQALRDIAYSEAYLNGDPAAVRKFNNLIEETKQLAKTSEGNRKFYEETAKSAASKKPNEIDGGWLQAFTGYYNNTGQDITITDDGQILIDGERAIRHPQFKMPPPMRLREESFNLFERVDKMPLRGVDKGREGEYQKPSVEDALSDVYNIYQFSEPWQKQSALELFIGEDLIKSGIADKNNVDSKVEMVMSGQAGKSVDEYQREMLAEAAARYQARHGSDAGGRRGGDGDDFSGSEKAPLIKTKTEIAVPDALGVSKLKEISGVEINNAITSDLRGDRGSAYTIKSVFVDPETRRVYISGDQRTTENKEALRAFEEGTMSLSELGQIQGMQSKAVSGMSIDDEELERKVLSAIAFKMKQFNRAAGGANMTIEDIKDFIIEQSGGAATKREQPAQEQPTQRQPSQPQSEGKKFNLNADSRVKK